MRKIFFGISFFVSAATFGQLQMTSVCNDSTYPGIPALTQIVNITKDIIPGEFSNGRGYCSYRIKLDSNMTFKKDGQCCSDSFLVDSGQWSINNSSTVVLGSKDHALVFYIFKFDNWLFFIQEKEKWNFIADLKHAMARLGNRKPVVKEGKTYSVNYIIGSSLAYLLYYARETDDGAGIFY